MHTLEELLAVMTAQRTKIDGINTMLIGLHAQVKGAMGDTITPSQQMRIDRVFQQAVDNSAELDKALTDNTASATAGAVSDGASMSDIKQGQSASPKSPADIAADLQAAADQKIKDGSREEELRGELAEIDARKKQIASDKAQADKDKAAATANQPAPRVEGDAATGPLDGAGQKNELPTTAPQGANADWAGDPANFGAPTTQTRGTRPGLPDTPGVPNAGASAQGGSATPPGQLTNAPGETRNVNNGDMPASTFEEQQAQRNDEAAKLGIGAASAITSQGGPMTDPQGDLTLPASTVADVGERDPSFTGGSALSPDGTAPAVTTRDPVDPFASVPQQPTLRADGGVPFVDPNNPPSPTGVDLGTDKQRGKAGLDPDFLPQQGNPAIAGASNASGDTTDKGPAMSGVGSSGDN